MDGFGSTPGGKRGSMSPVEEDQAPLFAELVAERGCNPFTLSAEVAEHLA